MERIALNSLVFVGYNLDDQNVQVIFDKISSALGNNRKETFLIAPRLKRHKISDLTQKGIQYIDCTGEEFLTGLMNDLKRNIVDDFEHQFVSPETFRKFMVINQLYPELRAYDDKYKMSALTASKGSKGNLTVKLKESDADFNSFFSGFFKGNRFGELVLSPEKVEIKDFSLSGISLLGSDLANCTLILTSLPAEEGTTDVVFKEGLELTDINYKVFASTSLTQIIAYKKYFEIKIEYKRTNNPNDILDFEYTIDKNFNSIREAIDLYDALKRISSGMAFTICSGGIRTNLAFPINENASKSFSEFLNYYRLLKRVEELYDLRFSGFGAPTQMDLSSIKELILYADSEEEYVNFHEGITIYQATGEARERAFESLNNADTSILVQEVTKQVIQIHNQTVEFIGVRNVEVIEPYFIESELNDAFVVKSKSNKFRVFYTRE